MEKIIFVLTIFTVVSLLLTSCGTSKTSRDPKENGSIGDNLTKCLDSNGDGVYDSCNQKGTGPLCKTVKDCKIKGCNDFSCVAGGTGKSCFSDRNCIEIVR